MSTTATKTLHDSNRPGPGCYLAAVDGRPLPLRAMRLSADACAGLARVKLEQRFVNADRDPVRVTYRLPLPADAAVAGFEFVLAGERVVGRIERRLQAREQFEQAIAEGRSAALLEEERSSLFRQEIGNLPPGAELVIEVWVDQPLTWLSEGAWEWRWPCALGPRFVGHGALTPDAQQLQFPVSQPDSQAELRLSLLVRDRWLVGKKPYSPSHALAVPADGEQRVGFAGKAQPDRDVVVRWEVARQEPSLAIDAVKMSGDSAISGRVFALLSVVPPAASTTLEALPRDLIVLIDSSGSMHGEPLTQAKRVLIALLHGLTARDRVELLAFGGAVERFRREAVAVTPEVREAALAWLGKLQANGGTQMLDGIRAALPALRDEAQRQILLITDGLIGFEARVIAEVLACLPRASRLHTLGVGSAVNRSLTAPLARAGRGSEHVIGLGEDVEPVLRRLLSKLEAPLLSDLVVSGSAVLSCGKARLPDLHAGSSVQIPLELAAGAGHVTVEGTAANGRWRSELELSAPVQCTESSPLAALFARERVEDLEMRAAAGEHEAFDAQIERLGLTFAISTRMTSWVARSERAMVDPTLPTRNVEQPQSLPYGMSVEAFGLRPMTGGALRGEVYAAGAAAGVTPPFAPAPMRSRIVMSRRALAEIRERSISDLPPAVMASAPRGMATSSRYAELRCEVALLDAGKLVINIRFSEFASWRLPQRVRVRLRNDREVELTVDSAHSTATVELNAGQSARLWLVLDTALESPPAAFQLDREWLSLANGG